MATLIKSTVFVITLLCVTFALDKASTPYICVPHATILSSGLNQNADSLRIAINRMIDSLDVKFARWNALKSGDTLFDTIRTTKAVVDTEVARTIVVSEACGVISSGVPNLYIKQSSCLGFGFSQGNDKKAYVTLIDSGPIYFKTKNTAAMRLNGDQTAYFYGNVAGAGLFQAAAFTTNGTDTLTYSTSSFWDSLYDNTSYVARAQCTVTTIGKLINLRWDLLYAIPGTMSTSGIIRGLPEAVRPSIDISIPVAGIKNDVAVSAKVDISSSTGYMHIYAYDGSEIGSAGGGGLQAGGITYRK
jgi:hypothetical protein